MAFPATMPAITHVAVTVTDLAVSQDWYTRVLGIKPVLDENTGPFRHVVYELGPHFLVYMSSPIWSPTSLSMSADRASITLPSVAKAAASS